MTQVIVMSCDGHRHGQPCRGAFPSRWRSRILAAREADAIGWRQIGTLDLCPSAGHDEDES